MKSKSRRSFVSTLFVSLSSAALMTGNASAATATKATTGTDLAAAASWSGGSGPGFPTSADVATWTTTSPGTGLTLASAASWGSISVTAAAADISVTGAGKLTLANGISAGTSTRNITFANPIALSATQTWNINSSKTLAASGIVSGPGFGITKDSGSGTLNLSNLANTYTGPVSVSAGTLQFGTLVNTQTYAFTGNALTLNGATLLMDGTSSSTYTHTCNFANLTAPISVTGSTISFKSGNATTKAFNAALAFSGSNIISYTNTNYSHFLNLNRAITGSGILTFNWSGTSTGRTVNLASGQTNNFTGTVVLNTAATTTTNFNLGSSLGATTYEVRNLWALNNNVANGLNSASLITLFNSTSAMTLTNPWVNSAASLTLNAGTVNLGASNSTIGTLNLAGNAAINTTGGTLTATTINTSSGTASGTATLVPAASGTITNGTATVATNVNTALDFSNAGVTVTANDATLNGNSDIFFGSNVTGAGGFTKMGAGSLAFNAAVTISGLVTASAGSINFNNATTKSFTGGLAGTGALNIGGTGLVALSGASAGFTGNINVADGAALGGEATTDGTLTLGDTTGANLWPDFSTPGGFTANTIVLNGSNSIRFLTPPAAGSYSLLKYTGSLGGTGSFSANFRGASINTTGGADGNEIVLAIGTPVDLFWNNAAGTLLWSGGVSANWNNGGANDFFYDADSVVFNETPGTDQAIVVSGVVSPGGITFPASNDTVNYSFTGDSISGPTSLIKSGAATLTLGMANTYAGGTTLNEGLLRAGNDTALGSAAVTINGGALATDGVTSLSLANPVLLVDSTTLGSAGDTGVLTLSGAVTLSGGNRTLTTASDAVFSGAVGGAFGLIKSGAAQLTLTAANSYASTTVDDGTLQVGVGGSAGTIPATAAIASPGTLRFYQANGASAITLAHNFSGDGTLAFKGTGISGQSPYALTGTNSSFTGTLAVESGARILTTTAAQMGSAANVNIASGGGVFLNPGTYANAFNIAGNGWQESSGQLGAIRLSNGATITGPVTLNADTRITPYSSTGTISGSLTGTNNLEINASTSTGFTGTLTYSGDGSLFTGATTVSQGTLNLTGTLGGSLAVSSTLYAATLNGEGSIAGTLTLGAVGKGANLTTNPNTAGAFTTGGAFAPAEAATVVTVNFSPAPDAVGTYTVLNYASTAAIPANFALTPGYRPVTFDTTTSSTATTVTTTAENLTWLGTTAVWDVATAENWKSATVNLEKFYQLDAVTFDETGGNFNPTLAVTVAPTSITFTNPTTDYTLTGAGVIAGAATFTKNGGKSLTLSTPNAFTGNVTVNGGKLVLGNAAALGAAGSKTVTVNATAQMDFAGFSPGATRGYTYKIAGAGDGSGVLINSSVTTIGTNAGIQNLELLADATIGGAGRFDLARVGTASGTITGNGHTLTKLGVNQVQLRGDATDLPAIIINAGTLGAEDSDLAFGGAAGNVTVNNTGTLSTYGLRTIATPVILNTGATLGNLGNNAGTWTGTITTNGSVTVNPGGQTLNLSGTVAGTGTITVPALGGILNLSGTNTFDGGLIMTHVTNNTATTVNLPATCNLAVAAAMPIQVGNNTGTGASAAQTFNVAGTVTNNGTLFVGRSGLLHVNGGAVWTQNGDMTVAGQGGYTATMNVAAGADFTYAGTNPININPGSSGFGYLYIDGTFTTSRGFETTVVGGANYLVTLRGGGTLKLSGNIADLTTGTTNKTQFALGSGGGLIDTNGFDAALSANISGPGNSLTKKGGGKLTLSGTNGYTGATWLDGGTLGGNGAAGSSITAATGTTLAPGASVGTFLAAGATLSAGATLAIEIDSTTDTADGLASSAAVDISGADVSFTEVGSGAIPAGTKLVLIDYTGTTLTGNFTGYTEGAAIAVGANTFTLSYVDSSRVTLTSTTVGSPYDNWAFGKGLDGTAGHEAGFTADPDKDGIANGLEWVLGGNPLAQDAASLVTASATAGGGLTLAFSREEDSIGQVTLTVEYDSDLVGPWTSYATVGATSSGPVTINTTPDPDAVSVNIPASNAVGGRLFARLKASQP
jgi:autotransporter-associated beta strand protein